MAYSKRPKKVKDKTETAAGRAHKPAPDLPPLQDGPPIVINAADIAPPKPRILLDNDIKEAREYLRAQGYTVQMLPEAGLAHNATDEVIFRHAAENDQLLLTADKRAYLKEARMPVTQSGGVVILPNHGGQRGFYEAALEHFARTCPAKEGALKFRIVAYEVIKPSVGGPHLYRNVYGPDRQNDGRRNYAHERILPPREP